MSLQFRQMRGGLTRSEWWSCPGETMQFRQLHGDLPRFLLSRGDHAMLYCKTPFSLADSHLVKKITFSIASSRDRDLTV